MKRLLGCLLLVMGLVGCDLSVARLEDKGAKITKNDQDEVVEIALFDTQITDAGLIHLKGLTKLKTLSLSDNFTDAGILIGVTTWDGVLMLLKDRAALV